MPINESSPAEFLADAIMRSPYFNDDAEPLMTLAQLDAYATELNDDANSSLADRLADMLDLDMRDLAHNSNYDDFLPADIIRELSDDDFRDIDAILNNHPIAYDPQFADILAAKLLDRAAII